jgi:hypothetical protein
MRSSFLFLLACMICSSNLAQPLPTVIKTQAIEMGKALTNNDAETFQKYMHPKVIEKAGGPDKMKAYMDSGFARFKKFNGQITRITYGNPAEILTYKKELQTTLPQTTEISTSLFSIIFESTLIAISQDKGRNWYFVDSNMYRIDETKGNLPELSPELVIPPATKPKYIPKEKQ